MRIPLLFTFIASACGIADAPRDPAVPGKADGHGEAGELPVARRFPIDGEIDLDAMTTSEASLAFEPAETPTVVRWGFARDDRNLYLAVHWTDATHDNEWFRTPALDFDQITLLIDDDGDGEHEPGEDVRWIRATAAGSFFRDAHVDAGGEEAEDAIGDGLALLRRDADDSGYDAELLIPLADDAEHGDAKVTAASRFQLVMWDHARLDQGKLDVAELFEAGSWGKIPAGDAGRRYAHPQLPTDLTGLIVFTSTHEHPDGEIYTFDPATGAIARVTNNDLPENNVSLSHDRTRVAFHAQADPGELTSYDIYTIAIDGTDLRQLTDDDSANAHPAWSPDDQHIIYSPIFPDPPSVVVISADGERIADITPRGIQDHDAEYLPDGRIVMKTDRWSHPPLFQIGVIDEDGANPRQLTSFAGGVDHDPVGDADYALFERYMKPTDYGDDPDAITTPWNLVEARLDGKGERTVVADPWVNSLPVYDPTGDYILYRRGPSYQEAVLVTRDGEELGRLIPGITQISYIDWK